jgi:hypothetical protein
MKANGKGPRVQLELSKCCELPKRPELSSLIKLTNVNILDDRDGFGIGKRGRMEKL